MYDILRCLASLLCRLVVLWYSMPDVMPAFASGGMPSMQPKGETRQNRGLSSGVTYMIRHDHHAVAHAGG